MAAVSAARDLVPRWLKALLSAGMANTVSASVKALLSKEASIMLTSYEIYAKVTSEDSVYAGKDSWATESSAFLGTACRDVIQVMAITNPTLADLGLNPETFHTARALMKAALLCSCQEQGGIVSEAVPKSV